MCVYVCNQNNQSMQHAATYSMIPHIVMQVCLNVFLSHSRALHSHDLPYDTICLSLVDVIGEASRA